MKQSRLTTIVSAAFLAGISSVAQADITVSKNDNYELSIYGFAKLDATYQSDRTNSLVAPRFATAGNDSATNLTAMDSRFGLKWKGPVLENGYQAGAVLEFDLFDPTSSNQMEVRSRLAAFTLERLKKTARFSPSAASPLSIRLRKKRGMIRLKVTNSMSHSCQ